MADSNNSHSSERASSANLKNDEILTHLNIDELREILSENPDELIVCNHKETEIVIRKNATYSKAFILDLENVNKNDVTKFCDLCPPIQVGLGERWKGTHVIAYFWGTLDVLLQLEKRRLEKV